jgi:hypothetical protein
VKDGEQGGEMDDEVTVKVQKENKHWKTVTALTTYSHQDPLAMLVKFVCDVLFGVRGQRHAQFDLNEPQVTQSCYPIFRSTVLCSYP